MAAPETAAKPLTLPLTPGYRAAMGEVLAKTYFASWATGYLDTASGRADLESHVTSRMRESAERIIPWISECFDLRGASVLEIGCGTGSSTVPIALAAGAVTACDISGPSLAAARERVRLLGATNVQFVELPTNWAQSREGAEAFAAKLAPVDVVLCIALLEHLTLSERLEALRTAWGLLRPGGILVVYETPNRLGFFDWHSFLLPFFHALPDALAIEYSSRTTRPWYELSREGEVVENLYRLGRGVSYHEFELAIGLDRLTVANDGASRHLAHRVGLAHQTYDEALREIFGSHLPRVPLGFTQPSLDLILKNEPPDPARPSDRPQRPSEAQLLRDRLREVEHRLQSQTDLTVQLLRVTAQNMREIARNPSELRERLRGWWRMRIGR